MAKALQDELNISAWVRCVFFNALLSTTAAANLADTAAFKKTRFEHLKQYQTLESHGNAWRPPNDAGDWQALLPYLHGPLAASHQKVAHRSGQELTERCLGEGIFAQGGASDWVAR